MIHTGSLAGIQTQLPNSIHNLSTDNPGEVSLQIISPENGETSGPVLDDEVNGLGAGETLPLVPSSFESNTSRDTYQSYDIQQLARWVEKFFHFHYCYWSFSFVNICKGERKNSVLIVISIGFMLHVVGIYWWFQDDDLLYPLLMIPPTNDTNLSGMLYSFS